MVITFNFQVRMMELKRIGQYGYVDGIISEENKHGLNSNKNREWIHFLIHKQDF